MSANPLFQTSANPGWRTMKLCDIADLFSGGTPPKSDTSAWRGDVPWVSPKDMKHLHLTDVADHITTAAAHEHSRIAPAGSIFVVVRGMVLAKDIPLAQAHVPMAFNQDMKAIVARDVDPEYLLYAILSQKQALKQDIGRSAHGTRRIGSAALEELRVPIPSDSEQRTIAGALTDLNRAVGAEAKRVQLLSQLRTATMHHVFHRGLRARPLRDTPLGTFPENWETVRLGTVTAAMNYGTSTHCVTEPHGAPVLRIPNVIRGEIDATELKYALLPETERRKLALSPGDLLFVRTNGNRHYTGRCAVYDGDPAGALFASYLIRVRIGTDTLSPRFVKYFLSSEGRPQLFAGANPAADGKFNIDTSTLRGLEIPVPPADEQAEIVELLMDLDARLRAAETRYTALSQLFDATVRALIPLQSRADARQTAPTDE